MSRYLIHEIRSAGDSLHPTLECHTIGPSAIKEQAQESTTIGHWAVLNNLKAGARLAMMLPVGRNAFRINFDQAVLLMLVSLAVSGLAEFAFTAPSRTFNSYGLGYNAAGYLVFLISVYLIARIQGDRSSATELVVILSSVVAVVAPAAEFLIWLGERADAQADPV